MSQTFKLTSFSPVGFKIPNFPVQHCSICRGYLTDVCGTCFENKQTECQVTNKDGNYHHLHCYNCASKKN